ncbi:MAG: type IV toxin-antitoxin system AbiEi family antitoxin domain-containing protein [Candidatus Helarchaeota archaeon]
MKFMDVYKTLESKKLFLFSGDDLLLFYPDDTTQNLRKLLYRWKRKGWIISLKKGLYEIVYPKRLNIPDLYIANKMYQPSYVSLETALSYYSIIPEVSMAVTSITTKPTRCYKNSHGLFLYHTVKPELFKGYTVVEIQGFSILIAEPEKAFIDYLYFQTYRKKKFQLPNRRFDSEKIKALERKKLNEYAALYHLDVGEIYANL